MKFQEQEFIASFSYETEPGVRGGGLHLVKGVELIRFTAQLRKYPEVDEEVLSCKIVDDKRK